jgi:hypothetical protein
MDTKFKVLYENLMERYQQGGFMIGDRVKFRDDCLKHDFFKEKAGSFIDLVKTCSAPGFDLNLIVSAIKSIYPTTTQNYRGGTESPDNIYVDIVVSYAPGLYRTPMTVPIEVLELQDDGANREPIPNSLKYDNKVHGPERTKAKSSADFEVNLKNKNVAIPRGNKWEDTPGGGSDWKDLPKNKRINKSR